MSRGLRRFVDALQRDLFDTQPTRDAPPASKRTPEPAARPEPAVPAVLGDRAALPQRAVPGEPAVPPDRAALPEPAVPPERLRPGVRREMTFAGRRIDFALKRTRRRSIGFAVGAGGLVVSAPARLALRDIEAAVLEKGRWIVAKLDEQERRAAALEASRVVWRDGAEVMYLGLPVRVAVDATGAVGGACLEPALPAGRAEAASGDPPARRLCVGLPAGARPEQLRDAVHGWLQREALTLFEARCRHFAPRLGVTVKRLSLSSAATRWGSASADGSIRLHWRLVHLPLSTIDYVVVHELAHLHEMNHSARFWAVVGSVVPDHREQRRRLRLSETRLLG